MGTTSDGGETIQLASESHLSWLQAGRRGAKTAGFAGYNSNQQTWKNIRIN